MDELKKSFRIPILFVLSLWIARVCEVLLDLPLAHFGIEPGKSFGLWGILFAPFIHSGFVHLFSNSIPVLILGSGMIYLYPRSSAYAIPFIYIFGGLGVWLFARASSHIGASGLVYGLASFIFFSGIVRRDPQSIALALITVFLYGGMVWGMIPMDEGISFESHLSGAVAGFICALVLKKLDIKPEPEFEDEEEDKTGDSP